MAVALDVERGFLIRREYQMGKIIKVSLGKKRKREVIIQKMDQKSIELKSETNKLKLIHNF